MLVSDTKASSDPGNYTTYMLRRLRALHAVTPREDPEMVKTYTAKVPPLAFLEGMQSSPQVQRRGARSLSRYRAISARRETRVDIPVILRNVGTPRGV